MARRAIYSSETTIVLQMTPLSSVPALLVTLAALVASMAAALSLGTNTTSAVLADANLKTEMHGGACTEIMQQRKEPLGRQRSSSD